MTADDAGRGCGLPLTVAAALPYERGYTRFIVRIEGLGPGSRLSAGINNSDGSFSLSPDQLVALRYLPPRAGADVPTLTVRVIGFRSDTAETVSAFALRPEAAEGTGTSRDTPSADRAEAPAFPPVEAEADSSATDTTAADARLADGAGASREAEAGRRLAEAEAGWKQAIAALERRLAEAEAARDAAERRLAAMQAAVDADDARRLPSAARVPGVTPGAD